ncbi:MAG: TonB-dependent receptor [Bacteroidia bacterium]
MKNSFWFLVFGFWFCAAVPFRVRVREGVWNLLVPSLRGTKQSVSSLVRTIDIIGWRGRQPWIVSVRWSSAVSAFRRIRVSEGCNAFLLSSMFLLLTSIASAQFSINGTVHDASLNKPLPNANVIIENSFTSTVTNSEGKFELKNLKQVNYQIRISYLGYDSYQQKISLNENVTLTILLSRKAILQDEVAVSATKADANSAMTFTELNKDEIKKNNFGQDIPYLLQLQPSTVATSDAGTGVGYTGLRIRGSDASRINVTVNGIPLNDAESQQLYWVDMPDLASSTDNIQVQRGVGTSTNGAGAFGGSINITTDKTSVEPFGEVNLSGGSFNTFKRNFIAGTGLIKNKFAFEGRLSQITSNGYVDRATADMSSYFLTGTYFGRKNFLRFNLISGKEKTYQAWNGVPESRINNDSAGMMAFIDRNYLDEEDAANLLNSGRIYNSFTYDNQTDNYEQKHYQLFYSQQINNNVDANIALHLTHGEGYYEEYKKGADYNDYNMITPIINSDTIFSTDLIRRKWLNNDFYGTTFSLNYDTRKKLRATFGGAWNQYDGAHYGQVIWAQYAGDNKINHEYYNDDALKSDFNIYAKATYNFTDKWIAFADVQYRNVNYKFQGFDADLKSVPERDVLIFFNPKAGITFKPDNKQTGYISFSVGNHEPSRDDYVNSSITSRPKAETLYDLESGYRYSDKNFTTGFNYYLMMYKNQLVLTGKINDVGEYTRTNIDNSFREGVEIDAAYHLLNYLQLKANATFSHAKIKLFNEYVDDYDNGGQQVIEHKDADIAFSPNLIANGIVSYQPIKNLSADFIFQHVDNQYLDNTSNNSRILKAYSTCGLHFSYAINKSDENKKPLIEFGLQVNNLLNEKYESNGYTYSYYYGGETTTENFYFPQAGTNFLGSLRVRF